MNWPTLNSDYEPLGPARAEEDDSLSIDANMADDNDSESDTSIDMLAFAREIDPTTVRAHEREYDANIAERVAEEIPAGSSAATAGGGSGFTSPADIQPREGKKEGQQQQKHGEAVPGLKRARTSDSINMQGDRAAKSPKLE